MEGDERGESRALAPACTIPVCDRALDYYGILHFDFDFIMTSMRLLICRTIELRAHTQPVGGGARQFRS